MISAWKIQSLRGSWLKLSLRICYQLKPPLVDWLSRLHVKQALISSQVPFGHEQSVQYQLVGSEGHQGSLTAGEL
jgi:hypothetical protein